MDIKQVLKDHGLWLRDEGGKRADLRGAYLGDADLRGADLGGAYLGGANLGGALIPQINAIHSKVLAAASEPDALDMSHWHSSCGTTHCRAGWVVTLAGDEGAALEDAVGTGAAAALIYAKSDPAMDRTPDWLASNESAMADMKLMAETEAK